jgi:hypothetical protein
VVLVVWKKIALCSSLQLQFSHLIHRSKGVTLKLKFCKYQYDYSLAVMYLHIMLEFRICNMKNWFNWCSCVSSVHTVVFQYYQTIPSWTLDHPWVWDSETVGIVCSSMFFITPSYNFSILCYYGFDQILHFFFAKHIQTWKMTNGKLFQVDFAYMLDVDSLGFNVKVTL